MRFEEWQPIYREILEDFGFSEDRDSEAAQYLSFLLEEAPDLMALDQLIRGRTVLVCGNAPTLSAELGEIISQQEKIELHGAFEHTVISADGATTKLLERGIVPDIIVTDLDGILPDIVRANELGSIVVVHAHGDNMEALGRWVPKLSRIVGTTQSMPFDEIYNFGGFTDGDRSVFLARHFKAAEIRLIGFDFDDESVTPMKKKKLKWARKLVGIALIKDDLSSKLAR